jgi:rod shape-determining protein MreD
MVFILKQFKFSFLRLFPFLFLLFISLNGSSIVDLYFFSISIHYIIIYFWVLRKPDLLSYSFIFITGIISDVVLGIPLGVNALSLLILAGAASYIRNVTVRITLLSDWISFIPALLITNLVYFLALYFSNYNIDYLSLFINSISTFVFYPFFWMFFSLILKLSNS